MEETDNTKKTFRKIQMHVERMVEMFKRSRFLINVAQKMSYEDGFTFNESNIIPYLAELEEYISSLITYSAFKKDDPNAAISAIPLEKLNQKDFGRRDNYLAIDPPVNFELNQDSAMPGEAKVETTDVTKSRELYQQFMRLVEGKGINFITHSQAKAQQNNIFKQNDEELSIS